MQSEYRFYGRRQGRKLSSTRAGVLDAVLPQYQITLDDISDGKDIEPTIFLGSDTEEIWFEVGFGNGEHLAEQAVRNPNIGMIGCEPFINGVSNLLRLIEKNNIENIRIWTDDARILMDKLRPNTISKIFVLHPDPWPKKKHHKRRFIQDETLDMFANFMKKSAELRLATDDARLADWMLDKVWHHKNFKWLAKKADDWRIRPDDWPETRYGKKQLAGKPVYLRFIRV